MNLCRIYLEINKKLRFKISSRKESDISFSLYFGKSSHCKINEYRIILKYAIDNE